jgi:hypothetical protein
MAPSIGDALFLADEAAERKRTAQSGRPFAWLADAYLSAVRRSGVIRRTAARRFSRTSPSMGYLRYRSP